MKYDTMSKIIGAAILAVSIVAYVILSLADNGNDNIQGLILFVSPVVTWLLMRDKIDSINETSQQIQKQTNGLLTRHIDEVAASAIEQVDARRSAETEGEYNGR